MKQPPASDPAPQPSGSQSTVTELILSMADTTWRMFVPTVGLLLFGRYLDTKWNTKPLLMLTGALIGAIIAGFLVKSQLKKGSKKE